MQDLLDTRVYGLIGEDGFVRLVDAFYRRVEQDDLLGPMYRASLENSGETMADAAGRLREFLIQRFGGPARYSAARGHPRLRMRHAGFQIDQVAAQRWVALMESSLLEAGIEGEAATLMRSFFADAAAFLVNS